MRRRIWLGQAAATGLLASTRTWAEQPEVVAIGLSSASFATAPARVADALGLFAAEGLKPRFVSLDSGSAAVTGLISGSLDVALAGSGEFVAAQAHGQPVVGLITITSGSGGTVVLAKAVADRLGVSPQAPVRERLKALDQLLFASPSAPSAYTVTLRRAVASTDSSVRFTYMAQAAMPAALERGAVQGFIASAPFWALPVVRGAAVAWLSAPRGELPPELSPASAIMLVAMREKAEARRGLMTRLEAVFSGFVAAVAQRPEAVKAALATLYPDLDAATLDLLFRSESPAWTATPITAASAAHEVGFVKLGGAPLAGLDRIDPSRMVLDR